MLNHFDLNINRELLQTQLNIYLALITSANAGSKDAFAQALKIYDDYKNIVFFTQGVTTSEKEKINLEASKFNDIVKTFDSSQIKIGKKFTKEFSSMGIKDLIKTVNNNG